jgi:hypothetical protein
VPKYQFNKKSCIKDPELIFCIQYLKVSTREQKTTGKLWHCAYLSNGLPLYSLQGAHKALPSVASMTIQSKGLSFETSITL